MPTTQADYQQVEQKRKEAREFAKEGSLLESKAGTFADDLMAKVRKARIDRGTSQLAEGVGVTSGQLAKGGAELRARTEGLDPLRQDVLTARERAGTLSRLETLSTAETERSGSLQELLGAGANQIRALATAKSAEAQSASAEAQDLIEMVQLREDQERRRFEETMSEKEYKTGVEQFGKEFGLQEKEFGLAQQRESRLGAEEDTDDYWDDITGFSFKIKSGEIDPEQAVRSMVGSYDKSIEEVRRDLGIAAPEEEEVEEEGGKGLLETLFGWGKPKTPTVSTPSFLTEDYVLPSDASRSAIKKNKFSKMFNL